MKRVHAFVVLLTFTVAVCSGCATLPYSSPLPKEIFIKKVAKVDPSAPFAVSKNGTVAAVSGETVKMWLPGNDTPRKVTDGTATCLSFNPSGDRLAVASGTDSTLQLFSSEGTHLGEAKVRGRATSIIWLSDHELLAASIILRKFSFGSEFVTLLHRWDGTSAPSTTTLSDVTIKKSTAAWPEQIIYSTFSMALSPYGDEIAYRFLKDPPLFAPYQSLMLRHLESGREHELTSTQIGSGGPFFSGDGERVAVGDMTGTHWLNLPGGKDQSIIPAAGSNIAASPSGSYLLLNGQLYREGQQVASFAPDSVGAFLPDGTGLVLKYRGNLYLVTGLKDSAPQVSPKEERRLKLRRLRSLGLITNEEFQKELARGSVRQ